MLDADAFGGVSFAAAAPEPAADPLAALSGARSSGTGAMSSLEPFDAETSDALPAAGVAAGVAAHRSLIFGL